MARWTWLACAATSAVAAGCESGPAAPAVEPTLANVQAKVFDQSCAFSGCHGSGSSPSGNLKLSDPQTALAQLVNQESTVVDEDGKVWLRVVPGQPDKSLLYRVLKTKVGTVGRMPPGVPLPSEQVELVRAWIAAGALGQ